MSALYFNLMKRLCLLLFALVIRAIRKQVFR